MRVLIIEDEKGMAELLKKGLEEENHRVGFGVRWLGRVGAGQSL